MNHLPIITKNLLIINVLCFFGSIVAQRYGINLNDYLGLHFFLADNFNTAQFITYMFMHANFQHIFFNMFAVWMFGRVLEEVWGPRRFLFYYIVCGIGAGLVQEVVLYLEYAFDWSDYTMVDTGMGIISMSEFLNQLNTVGAPFTASCWRSACCSPTAKCSCSPSPSPSRPSSLSSAMPSSNCCWGSAATTGWPTSPTWAE